MSNQQSETNKQTYFVSSLAVLESLTEFGISSIFILFLLHVLHFSIPISSTAYSGYYMFAYILPIFVGLFSDRHLSKSQSVIIGFVSMIISQLMLYLSASMYYPSSVEYTSFVYNIQNTLFVVGLIFLAIGISFTTNTLSNIISLISDRSNYSKLDSYSVYYSFINLGVIFGILIMTFIVGDSNYYQFKTAFLIFLIILIIGLILFLWGRNRFFAEYTGSFIEKHNLNENKEKLLKRTISKIKSAIYRITDIKSIKDNFISSLTKTEKDRMRLFFLLLIFIIVYRVGYTQSSASMIIFEENFVLRDYGFLILPVQFFSIFNPLFIILLSPLYTRFNRHVDETNWDFGIVSRIGIGLLLMALSFIVLSTISHGIDMGMTDKVDVIWIIIYEIIIALSELFLSVTGYAMVAKLVPKKYFAYYFGIFQSTYAIARYLTGTITSFFPLHKSVAGPIGFIPLNGLSGFFLIFAIPSLICGIILLYKRKSLERKVHHGEP